MTVIARSRKMKNVTSRKKIEKLAFWKCDKFVFRICEMKIFF